MSPKAPRITALELLKALHRDGWLKVRQTGSHALLKHNTKYGRVTVPIHAGVIIKPKTLETILKQANLSIDDLRELL
jgi:predicted RNA binding protein YcfA (HicA-like mRNA interferase family)